MERLITKINDNEIAYLSEKDTEKVLKSDIKPIKNYYEYCKETVLECNEYDNEEEFEEAIEEYMNKAIYSDVMEIDGELYERYDVCRVLGLYYC